MWDMHVEFDCENFTHRGFRFGQIMAYYCQRHYISLVNLKAFVEACEDENVDGRTND
jgi:hypothetical protein